MFFIANSRQQFSPARLLQSVSGRRANMFTAESRRQALPDSLRKSTSSDHPARAGSSRADFAQVRQSPSRFAPACCDPWTVDQCRPGPPGKQFRPSRSLLDASQTIVRTNYRIAADTQGRRARTSSPSVAPRHSEETPARTAPPPCHGAAPFQTTEEPPPAQQR